jgi:hypothetical protein
MEMATRDQSLAHPFGLGEAEFVHSIPFCGSVDLQRVKPSCRKA